MQRVLVAAAVLLLAAGGCGNDGGEGAATTTTTSTAAAPVTTTSELPPEDEWAVPDEIDEAYVERVLTKLYEIQGDATRLAIEEGIVTGEVIELLDAALSPRLASEYANSLTESSLHHFAEYRRKPADVEVNVQSLTAKDSSCLGAHVRLDFSGVVIEPVGHDAAVELRRTEPIQLNPTGWIVTQAAAVEATLEDGLCSRQ